VLDTKVEGKQFDWQCQLCDTGLYYSNNRDSTEIRFERERIMRHAAMFHPDSNPETFAKRNTGGKERWQHNKDMVLRARAAAVASYTERARIGNLMSAISRAKNKGHMVAQLPVMVGKPGGTGRRLFMYICQKCLHHFPGRNAGLDEVECRFTPKHNPCTVIRRAKRELEGPKARVADYHKQTYETIIWMATRTDEDCPRHQFADCKEHVMEVRPGWTYCIKCYFVAGPDKSNNSNRQWAYAMKRLTCTSLGVEMMPTNTIKARIARLVRFRNKGRGTLHAAQIKNINTLITRLRETLKDRKKQKANQRMNMKWIESGKETELRREELLRFGSVKPTIATSTEEGVSTCSRRF